MTTFLLAVDLEDIRDLISGGEALPERVPAMTERYLSFFSVHKLKATFFCVGDVARRYPQLIRDIIGEGHEIACHGDRHKNLTTLTEESFRSDLSQNIEALTNCGVPRVFGFRAPTFSLVKETVWTYKILAEFGITYSSSVLPAMNPLFGWPEFGSLPKIVGTVLEIPITLLPWPLPPLPSGGGIYFRVIPNWLLAMGHHGQYVSAYFHPYDIDGEQDHIMHPGIHENQFYNFLMRYGRSRVFDKLQRSLKRHETQTYFEFSQRIFANSLAGVQ